MKKTIFLIVVLLSCSIAAQNTYLHCGKLIDTNSGEVLTNKTIVVTGNKITAIQDGFASTERADDIIIDLKDKTVMPGFIDMHVHIEGETSPTQ